MLGAMRSRIPGIAFVVGVMATPAQADPVSLLPARNISVPLQFETSGQSMWGPGSAFTFDFNRFFGPQWNKSATVGGFTDVSFLGTFGARATVASSGKLGVDVGAHLNGGSVGVTYPGTATLTVPANPLKAGQAFTVGSSFVVGPSASLTTTSPNAQIFADMVVDVNASITGRGCAFGACSSGNASFDFETTKELFSFDRNGNGKLQFLGNDPPGFQFGSPVNTAFGSLTVDLPSINTAGGLSGNALASHGRDDFLKIGVDVDKIATSLLGLPPLSGSTGFGPVGLKYNLLDLIVGPDFDFAQDFRFTPNLLMDLQFDRELQWLDPASPHPISVSGLTLPVGASATLLAPFSTLTATPTFRLDNTFHNRTDLLLMAFLDFKLLSGSLEIPVISDPSFGPIFSQKLSTEFQFGLCCDRSWMLPFDPIAGSSFKIKVAEPSTVLLFAIGAGLSALGRRRIQKR